MSIKNKELKSESRKPGKVFGGFTVPLFIRKGNISVVLLVGLVVLLSGASILTMSVNSKFAAKQSYERMANRYIAESGIDMAIGLFENYISAQDFVISYTQNGDGSYSLIDEFSPYLLDEIRQHPNAESVSLDLISTESADYLASIGFLEFKRSGGVELSIDTFFQKENFKLSQMCIEPNFLIGNGSESSAVKSKINPIYLRAISKYKGGEVLVNLEISDLYLVREPFMPCDIGELANVKVWVEVGGANVTYVTYQNYRKY